MRRTAGSLLLWMVVVSAAHSENHSLLLRFPALSPDGSQIAFSFQGDIWTVPSAGGKATRLTVHEAYEGYPKFSPDGRQIAFSGARYGNDDLFIMPSEGGTARRLTYHSAADSISGFTPDGNILFGTNREYNRIERPTEIYSISCNGGTESRLLDAVGFDPAMSPDGRFIAFVRGDANPIYRQEYRGSSNRDVWLFDTKTKTYSRLTDFETNDILPQWGGSRTLYFLSSNTGRYNLYRARVDEAGKPKSKPEKITDFKDYSIRYFGISADGRKIVFERQMGIFAMDVNSATSGAGAPHQVNIQIGADDRFDSVEYKSSTTGATQYAVSPDAKTVAFDVRGEVFVKEIHKEKTRSVNLSNSPSRDMDPAWLSNGSLLFTSDRLDNNFDLYLAKSADSSQSDLVKSLKHEIKRLTKTSEDESAPVVSNDGKRLAYVRGIGTLVVADISKDGDLTDEKILLSGWSQPSGIVWSPDDKWVSYSLSDLYFNEEVFIQGVDPVGKPTNVSMHPRDDSHPFWSSDGSKLGFLSARNSHNTDVWFVWLKREDWERTKSDWEDREPPATAPEKKPDATREQAANSGEMEGKPLQIDLENIHERIVQVTNFPGDEGDLAISRDGETFYYTGASSTAKGRDLYSIKWDGKDLKEITKGGANPVSVSIDREGKYLYYRKGEGLLNRHDLKADKPEPLPYAAKMRIDYRAEREQIFEEAWRTIRDGFYDPQFHGKDWGSLRSKYRDLCVSASTNNDFRDMFNYMLGELNSSHTGFTVPERASTQKDATGLLGAELAPSPEGMVVLRVIPNSPADKAASKLFQADIITAVDGVAARGSENFYALLNAKVDEKTLLTVKGKDGKEREVAIRPASSERQLLYQEWVKERKKLVDTYSQGRLGYIHIQGMDFPSFEVFERELTAAGYGKEGLVVDVRYNGGGSTTDYLMTVLNYKQHAYTIPRGATDNLERDKKKFREYYPIGERLVYSTWLKPSIALCNEGSYSNAEIFSHAYQTLGIGKLVGLPTNGSVISTGGRPLIDGSFVRLPLRGWFVKATDRNQELGPAVPDIIVHNPVDWIAKGVDDQLKAAVDELLKEIDSKK